MADAKAALRAACLELWQNPSTDELLALIRESPSEKRISPFLAFLGDGDPKIRHPMRIQRLCRTG
jgi:hypothetical protein